ncbi:MAG: hypothetical protein CVT49_13910 [candidate division Zixibacteria bacterium HGW-Zixibacteria-1]|nr:MAG: hypothetical protein CVT49_13910 [candidate division Zixibacteria bacterium HGW-Zixibacteria-1]
MSTELVPEYQIALEQKTFITKVYGWMSLALVVTSLVAMFTVSTPQLINAIMDSKFLFYALLIGEVLLVIYLSAAIQKMSAGTATLVFLLYSAINGLTLSIIFVLFTSESIASTFMITAVTFGAMSIYGYFTKRDLTTIGNLAFMALIGLIIASVVNIFWHNSTLYWITTYAGVLIFVALTAYDTQKIKKMSRSEEEGTEQSKKMAIMGALALYLDFINLFLMLLRIFGKRR